MCRMARSPSMWGSGVPTFHLVNGFPYPNQCETNFTQSLDGLLNSSGMFVRAGIRERASAGGALYRFDVCFLRGARVRSGLAASQRLISRGSPSKGSWTVG